MGRFALSSWIVTIALAYFGLGGMVGRLAEGYDRAELSMLPLIATGLALLASVACSVVWLRRPRKLYKLLKSSIKYILANI